MRTSIMQARRHRWLLASALTIFLVANTAIAEEDHLKGYKIKDLNKVAPTNPVTVDNQFGNETCELKKPQFFLVQSEKNTGDDPRGGPAGEFVCYKAKCTGALPPNPTDRDSQFGLHSLELKKAKLVCLPVAACTGTGQLVGGYCWYLGAAGQSCDTVCVNQGLSCDPATINYAGSGGTNAQCDAVLDALDGPGTTTDYMVMTGYGCFDEDGGAGHGRSVTATTTCPASFPTVQRACACS